MAKVTFTADRREKFLELLASGRNQEEACAEVGVSRTTIRNWLARGRSAGGSPEATEFANGFDAIRDLEPYIGLSQEDLIRLLEKAARSGSVRAAQLLLEKPWERKRRGDQDPLDQPKLDAGEAKDPFSQIPGDELAERRVRSRPA